MKETVETMKLENFIENMKKGYGFYRPSTVMKLGEKLEEVIFNQENPEEFLEKEVQVKFIKCGRGYGPNFVYEYGWTITGIKIPKQYIPCDVGRIIIDSMDPEISIIYSK